MHLTFSTISVSDRLFDCLSVLVRVCHCLCLYLCCISLVYLRKSVSCPFLSVQTVILVFSLSIFHCPPVSVSVVLCLSLSVSLSLSLSLTHSLSPPPLSLCRKLHTCQFEYKCNSTVALMLYFFPAK